MGLYLDDFKKTLSDNRAELAFIAGNGINRFAYGDDAQVSWNDMLLEVWQQISDKKLTEIPEGITLTEFYDMMELEAGSFDKVRRKVVGFFEKWKPADYHHWLQERLARWNVPLLTTNFDRNMNAGLTMHKMESAGRGFTDYYPWGVYFAREALNNPLAGFGVWHINGMLDYRRSIRLSLSEYTNLSARTRSFLHSDDAIDKFDLKNINRWNGYRTWLHVIFNRSLCIFGLGLGENETFLRWLLIERTKYFRKHPEREKRGWYVCRRGEDLDGKRFLLDYLGFQMVVLDDCPEIYEGIFE